MSAASVLLLPIALLLLLALQGAALGGSANYHSARGFGPGGSGRPPKCAAVARHLEDESSTRALVKEADAVFVGRVRGPIGRSAGEGKGSGVLEFPVEVKRVLKGDLRSKETALLKLRYESCEPSLRIRQTLLFTAARGAPGGANRLQLTAYPHPLSLRVLDKFNAAARGEPYVPRPQIIETPCERKHCAHNADCIEVPAEVHPSGAVCECVTNCPDYDSQKEDERVCGSDNRVYPSICHLRMSSCKNRLELYVKHEGECDAHSPCVDHHCSQIGSHCVLDAADRPRCECIQYCSPKVFRDDWVCGDDGVDYRNICELQRASCLSKTAIGVKHNGTCDPCSNMRCPHGTICVLDEETREAKCDCGPDICHNRSGRSVRRHKRSYDREVCASDYKTYSNECEMKRQSCREQRRNNTLKVVYKGHCDTGVHPCSIHSCGNPQHRCELEPVTGTPRCVCGPSSCPKVYAPLCVRSDTTIDANLLKDSNGGERVFTIDSYCNLAKLECRHGRRLEVLHEGKCDACEILDCSYYSTCVKDVEGRVSCVCPKAEDCLFDNSTTKEQYTICGTNGETYFSECHLRAESCKRSQHIAVAHSGECDLCAGVICSSGAHCSRGSCHRVTPHGSNELSAEVVVGASTRLTELTPRAECECHLAGTALRRMTSIVGGGAGPGATMACSCECKRGVTGANCDRCMEGYWGLHVFDFEGCTRCDCNAYGSLRPDCDQNSGRCVCRPGVIGAKCDLCKSSKKAPGPDACGKGTGHYGINVQLPRDEPQQTKSVRHLMKVPGSHSGRPVYNFEPSVQNHQPKTVHVIPAPLLGDLCETDNHCGAPRSVCRGGACVCESFENEEGSSLPTKEKLVPSADRTACVPIALKNTTRSIVPSLILNIPGVWFNGRSSLAVLAPDATFMDASRHAFSLHIEIRPSHHEGVLVYSQATPTGHGDRVGLSLVGGRVEFFYDLGGGPVRLVSPGHIRVGTSYLIQARRYRKDGWLRVQALDKQEDDPEENSEPVTATAPGSLTSLDLEKSEVFIGRVASNYSRVYRNIGTTHAFHGCLSLLQINGLTVKFPQEHPITSNNNINDSEEHFEVIHNQSDDGKVRNNENDENRRSEEEISVSASENIVACSKAHCAKQPCAHNAMCIDTGDSYRCVCPPNYTGARCEYETDSCLMRPCMYGAPCEKTLMDNDVPLQDSSNFNHRDNILIKYKCKCPAGLDGDRCQNVESSISTDLWIPSFSGRESYLRLESSQNHNISGSANQQPRNNQQHVTKQKESDVRIEIWLMVADDVNRRQASTILYWTENARSGDYLVLIQEVNGALRMRYNLGSGPADIRSQSPLSSGVWHRVNLKLRGKRGSMSIDGGPPSVGVSPGAHAHLTLNAIKNKIYIGAPPAHVHLNPLSGATRTSFRGAVQRVLLNDKPMKVLGPLGLCDQHKDYERNDLNNKQNTTCAGREVLKYRGKPCETLEGQRVCQNGGTCLPLLNDLICLCPDTHRGKYCEHNKNLYDNTPARNSNDAFGGSREDTENEIVSSLDKAYHFNGNERHAYRNRLTKTRSLAKGTRYQMEFKTNAQNGLMMYRANSAKDTPLSRDYISLALSRGKLQLAFVCGGDLVDDVRYLQSSITVNNSLWHKVTIRQRKNSIQLKVNREKELKAKCRRPLNGLKPNTKLWLGGAPKNSLLYSTLVSDEYLTGFKGCIRRFSVNNQIIDLTRTVPGSSTRPMQLCHHI